MQVVFLNACETAGPTDFGRSPKGPSTAFKHPGQLHLTLWQVEDEVAQTFALLFYQSLSNREISFPIHRNGKEEVEKY